ncbi:MAG: transcription termination/antitermination protein NusG [Methylocella sp.]
MEWRLDWYAAYTKAQAEARAAEGIVRRGFTAYLPMAKRDVRHRGKRLSQERPLFPRYLFIGFTAAPPWLTVVAIEGVIAILRRGEGGDPLRIDAGIIAQHRRRIAAGELEGRREPVIWPGMAVRITEGPLQDMEGTCTAITGDRRADCLVSLIGQMVRVKLAIDRLVMVP